MNEHPFSPTLHTPRLVLRPFALEDAEAVYTCCRLPELGDNAGWKPHENRAESREVIRNVFLGKEGIWAITERASGELVGSVGLLPDPKRENPDLRMLGYWLAQSRWGKGLMSEAVGAVLEHAFTAAGLTAVSVCCYPHNARSQRLIERSGFCYEGTLHHAVRDHRGLLFDLRSYWLDRKQWAQTRTKSPKDQRQ